MSSVTQHTNDYDCGVCGDSFPATTGVHACNEHFYCNWCATEAVMRSMGNKYEFPVSCCSRTRDGVEPAVFRDLLGDAFMEKYTLRLEEHKTPVAIRVYCANARCAKFIHPGSFDESDQQYTVASCECDMVTCVGCKAERKPDHQCESTNPSSKPAWMPEYSSDCRIKQCPKCHEWIQRYDACNHMTCSLCQHQFFFICLLPWAKVHESLGCPLWGDVHEGHDSEGFELTKRGIHLYTGRDRNGFDRKGFNQQGVTSQGFSRQDFREMRVVEHGRRRCPQHPAAIHVNPRQLADEEDDSDDEGDSDEGDELDDRDADVREQLIEEERARVAAIAERRAREERRSLQREQDARAELQRVEDAALDLGDLQEELLQMRRR